MLPAYVSDVPNGIKTIKNLDLDLNLLLLTTCLFSGCYSDKGITTFCCLIPGYCLDGGIAMVCFLIPDYCSDGEIAIVCFLLPGYISDGRKAIVFFSNSTVRI